MTVQLAPVLQELHDLTVERLGREKEIESERELRRLAAEARSPFDFDPCSSQYWPRIIAEVKLASPSEGDIAPELDPVEVAKAYFDNEATALSVLTEPTKFKGSKEFLKRIRQAHPRKRILMKDFFIDWYQLLQARVYGADAVLLIVDFIERELLLELYHQAQWLGLTPLVEVHNPDQLEFALSICPKSTKFGPPLIGVNNRDLCTMQVSLETSAAMEEIVHKNSGRKANFITESGIRSGKDIDNLSRCGYEAFLVGTQLMKSGDPGTALRNLMHDALDAVD